MADTAKEQLSEKETTTKEAETPKLVCPFLVRRQDVTRANPKNEGLWPRISDQVKVDKETLVVSPVVDQVNLDAEIQTFKDQCGLELMKTLLAQGKASPEDFYDDGKHGVDMRLVPDTIHEAKKVADEQSAQIAAIAKALGVQEGKAISSNELIELLSKQVAANMQAQSAAKKEGE